MCTNLPVICKLIIAAAPSVEPPASAPAANPESVEAVNQSMEELLREEEVAEQKVRLGCADNGFAVLFC